MKELSIEEKAKRYDEAIKVTQRFYNNSVAITKKGLEDIFPELKESGGEKIRKALIEMVHDTTDNELWIGYDVHKEDALAWLEKQGEKKPAPKYKIGDTIYFNSFGKVQSMIVANIVDNGDNNPMYEDTNGSSIFENDIIGQKPTDKVEPKFKVGDRVIGIISDIPYFITEVCDDYYNTESGCIIMFCAQDNFELYEQNPAWSEEDKARFESCIKVLQTSDGYDTINVKWLKSLKDKVQPQTLGSRVMSR